MNSQSWFRRKQKLLFHSSILLAGSVAERDAALADAGAKLELLDKTLANSGAALDEAESQQAFAFLNNSTIPAAVTRTGIRSAGLRCARGELPVG